MNIIEKITNTIDNMRHHTVMHCDTCDRYFVTQPWYYTACSNDCMNKYYWYRCDKCAKVECFGTCKKGVDYC